jgi:hypothetical protein
MSVLSRLKARAWSRLSGVITSILHEAMPDMGLTAYTQAAQRALWQQYQLRKALNIPLPQFSEVGFRVYSRFDEDGILLFLFAVLGLTNKVCVELAFGSPHGANTTNLICNWGWRGLLIEGEESLAEQARTFFANQPDTLPFPPMIVQAWVDSENVNAVLRDNGIEGEIDLFSLDMDGIDYWVWKRLEVVRPRVVVVECSGLWPPDRAVTVPELPRFSSSRPVDPYYQGASLAAFTKLGRAKGYRLVGVHRQGFNAFFVRDDVSADVLHETTPEKVWDSPEMGYIRRYREEMFPTGLPGQWVDV